MIEKLLVLLTIIAVLVLLCLGIITYKTFLDPVKVIIVPIDRHYSMPIAPEPDWSAPRKKLNYV